MSALYEVPLLMLLYMASAIAAIAVLIVGFAALDRLVGWLFRR